MTADWIVAIAALAAVITVWALLIVHRGRSEFYPRRHHTRTAPSPQVRQIRISGSYHPSEVHVSAGQPTRLIFRREETAPCSERVVFPDFGISLTLPAYEDVAVDLPASEPGEHEFMCEMEMLRGRLVIDRVDAHRASPREVVAS